MTALVLVVISAPTAQFPGDTRPVAVRRSTGQALLQRVKQALKAPDQAWAATMVSGKAVRGGVEQAYSFGFLRDGRFVQTFQGSDSKTLGNDGRRYWQDDRSHFVQTLEFGARDRQMAINLLLSDNWLFAPAPIQLTAGDNVVHVLFKETGVGVGRGREFRRSLLGGEHRDRCAETVHGGSRLCRLAGRVPRIGLSVNPRGDPRRTHAVHGISS